MEQHQLHTQPRGARAARELRGEVQDFLNRLAHALTTGDGMLAADCFELPALIVDEDEVILLDQREQVARMFGAARDHYYARGIVHTRADLIDLERIGSRLVIASVRWPYLDTEHRQLGAETSDYTLRRDSNGELRIRCVLSRGVDG
jgi:hypothetical protein